MYVKIYAPLQYKGKSHEYNKFSKACGNTNKSSKYDTFSVRNNLRFI